MGLRKWGSAVLQVGVVLVVLSLVAGSVLGQPVLLSYVETESMAPTLEAGDGFVAMPIQLDGSVREGDVVVFEAESIQGGGLTTHRIVGETDRGFITKGDGNPFTDQDDDEPPVKRAQIVAKALQVDGRVVVIPRLGTVVEGTRAVLEAIQRRIATTLGMSSLLGATGLAYLFFATTLLWYVAGMWRNRRAKARQRAVSRTTGVDSRVVVGAFAALLVLGATSAMVVPSGSQEYGIVSAEFHSERPTVIHMGDSKEVPYPVGNAGFLPTVAYLEPASEAVDIRPREAYVRPRSVVNATVTLHAPPQTGYYRRFVLERRYLALLPAPTLRTLYAVHPWAPVLAIDALLGVPFYLLGLALVGTGRVRSRSRSRELPLGTRLRRLVGRLY